MHFGNHGVFSFVAAGAMAFLSGCGGGDEMSLAKKWQLFTEGNPTLDLSGEQALNDLTAVLERTTHSIEFGASIDGPAVVAVPEPAERPADWKVAVTPVMEHNGIPVAEVRMRLTFSPLDAGQTFLADVLSYDGWLEDTHWGVAVSRLCLVDRPDCSGDSPKHQFASVSGSVDGRYSGSNPAGPGSATWTGVMIGMESPEQGTAEAAALLRERPDVFLGDARIEIDDLDAPDVDVSFTNIRNVTAGTRRPAMTWENLRVVDGLFGSYAGERNRILGMFNGSLHQETGGEFEREGIAGAFGAQRR